MKKLLAIILAGLMVFSAVGVFAEETTTTEDITTPNGYLGTEGMYSYEQSFEYDSTFGGYTGSLYNKTDSNNKTWTLRHGKNGKNANLTREGVDNEILSREDNTKYLKFSISADDKGPDAKDSTAFVLKPNPIIFTSAYPVNGAQVVDSDTLEVVAGDKLNISFDISTGDHNIVKSVKLQEKYNDGSTSGYQVLTLDTDGYMKFYNESEVTYKYEVNSWYSVDVVFDFLNMTTSYTINDELAYEGTIATYNVTNLKVLGFAIYGSADSFVDKDYTSADLSVDNIKVSLAPSQIIIEEPEPEPEPEPEITIPETSGTMNGELIDETTSYTNYFTDDFEEEASVSTTTGTRKGVTIDIRYATGSGGTNRAPFDLVSENSVSESSNNYMVFYQPSTRIDNYGPAYQYRFAFDNLAQSEEIHLAFDMKNMDSVSSKQVFLSRSNQPLQARDSRTRNLVYMGKDGLMHFGNFDTSIDNDYSISYNISQWYHFDIVFDYTSVTVENEVVTAASGEVRYYVDGVLVYTVTNVDFYDIRNNSEGNYFSRFGFGIDNKEEYSELKTINGDSGTQPFAEEMKLGVDNLYVQIISAENEPNVTIATPAYSLTDFAVTDFTIGQAGTITASATLTNTDPTKKVTFAIATYNANNELTGIKIGATYVLSGNISLTSDVAATDTCVKVFVLDDAASITPIQAATVIGTQAS